MKSGDTLTLVLLGWALLPAWFGWRSTAELGTKLPAWNRRVQRIAFACLVYLAAFGCVTLVLWRVGVAFPSLDAIAAGPGRAVFWLPPVTVAWAAITYGMLRMNTRTGRQHEKPS
jgi:hypothetical protein